jgi:tRNA nucleotidyltransferase (CCA-adding enzyme)
MKIILTHEQTDFDGLASLLGAYLLDNTSIPVLPRRMNRNVKAFLTLYGVDLPFVDPRDLKGQEIEVVTLVDTQALTSIKGMSLRTKVKVIDHHFPKIDLPTEWEVITQETGANTTIFVEAIEEQFIHLDIIQATLLLLGIYEDTGSLSYTRTQPRDVRAAAFLLEQGASLKIAHNFTNHPLSIKQQEIYDQLRKEVHTASIHGHTILIAEGNARHMDEELSTIAHKLRDLLDPDALFLLIDIHGGVQLIARSTSDSINVSEIASYFGGGGHPRAAAALIKNQDRTEVLSKLQTMLPRYVQPRITVAEIMSGIPIILKPSTPIQEIAEKMQRYGYEGYPVVEKGEIVGLVTRRDVDRAISHKLNLTAYSLMEPGNIHIHPDNDLEYLQNLMTDTGWGQIPVVERKNHNIIGIVTRTDLIKTLSPVTNQFRRRNLAEKLATALPPIRLALLQQIAEVAQKQNAAIYIVGGFVRDLLLDLPSLDFDIVVEGNAIVLAKEIQIKFGGRVTTHTRFGTAKWFLDKVKFGSQFKQVNEDKQLAHDFKLPTTLDFITARREFYSHPTALPTVERGSIKLDLHRRDFTINTLAIRLDGNHFGDLHDYWGGYNDLQQGLVRVLHSLSFIDDPTRILRAVRYEQRYDFLLGERTHNLLLAALPMLQRISGDRVRHEIDKVFGEAKAIETMDRLQELGILSTIHPDLIWDNWVKTRITKIKIPAPSWRIEPKYKNIPTKLILSYTIWFMRLPLNRAKNITKRLRLPTIVTKNVLGASSLWEKSSTLINAKPSVCTAKLNKLPVLAIYAVYSTSKNKDIRRILFTYITDWKLLTSRTNGHDLEARQIPPGPIYNKILSRLRDAWLDKEINTFEEELTLLDDLIKDNFGT